MNSMKDVMDAVQRPKKRLFLFLILISLLITGVSIYGLFMVSLPGLTNISYYLPLFFGGIVSFGLALLVISVGGIILAIMGMPIWSGFQGFAWWTINLLFPIATTIGKCFDVDKEKIERSFIEVSNHLVKQKMVKVAPDKLLILTPHCIQQENCPHKITGDAATNCKQCGGCQVGDLVKLSQKYGVHLAVVTGGTLARKVIKTLRPKAVLAIACERDLTSGIQDVFPLPVIGVLNERPYGPCCNTRVDINKVEVGILDFIDMRGVKN